MGRHYLVCYKDPQKANNSTVVQNTENKAIKCCRVILLDKALELQVNETHPYAKPKIDYPNVSVKQSNRIVFESSNDISSVKNNYIKNPKVNFVNFINYSKGQTENNNKDKVKPVDQVYAEIKEKQKCSKKQFSGSNKTNLLVSEQDRLLHPGDNQKLKVSKPVLNLVPVNKRFLEQINLKQEQRSNQRQLETQKTQANEEAQLLISTNCNPVQSSSSISGKISKILSEQQLLNKKVTLQRVIKLHPLNLNTFKSSQKHKKYPLSNIVKTVIKNNLLNEIQKNSSKEAFPVALKSINDKDIKLLHLSPTNQNSEQILGL